ncbi:Thioesterase/thiol ester dehydrase-isomerase [Cytidiella melzeri]|nr:Thioesterase/thiol ester dehydrase-isomerase [Cytidiella melzeri]
MLSNVLRRQARITQLAILRRRFNSTQSPDGSSLPSRILRRLSLLASVGFAAYGLGSVYPPALATYIAPRIAPPPPDASTPSAVAYTAELEDELQNLPLLQKLRSIPDANEWYETRPYAGVPREELVNSLTAGTLRGPGKLALTPLVRARKDESEAVVVMHLGTALCGHEGIVHGGMLATLLDESLGRIALLNLPDKVGVTAKLSLNYRAPTRANQFVVIKTHVDEQEGRKVKVSGRIEDLDGNTLVEAQALFVQPRYAKMLNAKRLHARLGRPLPDPSEPPVEGSLAPSPAVPLAASKT